MQDRRWISRATAQVLNGAEETGLEYRLGFFSAVDWELIATEVYGSKEMC